MKFGTLRVRRPDGIEFDYGLDLPSTIIGRAEGSGITIDDRSISRRHARITIDSGQVLIEDLGSANGTFLDGRRLPPNVPSLVDNIESIRLGDVDVRYARPAEVAAVAPGGLPASPRPEDDVQRQHIVVTLQAPVLTVEAGSAVTTTALIQNRGRIVDELSLAVLHVPPHWVVISHPALRLLPGEESSVTITFHPPRLAASHAGSYDYALAVTSTENDLQEQEHGKLIVQPYFEAAISLRPLRAKRDFRMVAENRGNELVTFKLEGHDDEEAYGYQFQDAALVLQPGESRNLPFQVRRHKRKWFGQAQSVPFSVVAIPTTAGLEPVVVPGQVLSKPPLEKFKRPAQMLVLALVILGAALAVYLIRKEDGEKKAEPAAAVNPEAEYEGVHMCTPKSESASGKSSPTPLAQLPFYEEDEKPPPKLVSIAPLGGYAGERSSVRFMQAPPPLFAQNDARWGNVEYARARDPKYGPDWCGTSIAQCGCAMTSITNIMALWNLLVLPNDKPTNPQNINEWFNLDATETKSGWVSRGYVYGDVIWTSVNSLSAQMHTRNPNSGKIRFSRTGSGSEEEVRAELAAGRPIILEVPGHWIIAYALEGPGGQTIRIKDPFYPEKATYDVYRGKVKSSVLFEPTEDSSAVVFTIPANQRLRITDSKGNVVGSLNPGANPAAAVAQSQGQIGIPGASIQYHEGWRDPTCVESPPPAGSGTIQVTLPGGLPNDYKVESINTDGEATSVAIHTYDKAGNGRVDFVDQPGPLQVTLAWPGGDADNSTVTPTVTVEPGGGGTIITPGSTSPTPAGTPTPGGSTTPSASATTGPGGGSPTAPPASPTPPPSNVAIDCTTATSGTPPVATLSCKAAVTGTATNLQWRLNGLLMSGFNGSPAFTASFTSPATVQVALTACNNSACKEVAKAVAVNVGDQTAAIPGVPTPTPTPAPGDMAPTGVELDCGLAFHRNPPSATVSCVTRFNGLSTAVKWSAPGATPPTAEGTGLTYSAEVTFDQTLVVSVTVCNQTACADAVSIDLRIVVDPPTVIDLANCTISSAVVDCLASVSTTVGATSQWRLAIPGYSAVQPIVPITRTPVGLRPLPSLTNFRAAAQAAGAITGAGVYPLTVTIEVCKTAGVADTCKSASAVLQWALPATVTITSCGTPSGAGTLGCNASLFVVSGSVAQWSLTVNGYTGNFGGPVLLAPGQSALTLSQALNSFREAAIIAGAITPGQTYALTVTLTACSGQCVTATRVVSWVP